MLYLWTAITSHLLFAVNSVIDKFLLHEKRISNPASYAFAIGVLSLAVLVLAPFGFGWPKPSLVILSLLAGALFTFALLFLFTALKAGEASRVVPVVGGFVAFFTLVFAYFLVGERLLAKDLLAFGLLVAGMILMAGSAGRQFSFRLMRVILTAAVFFGLSFALSKIVYNELGFINGLIWTKLGSAIGAALLLLPEALRAAIWESWRPRQGGQNWPWFLTGQGVGALAGFLQNYAIALGSVSLVNALQGTQFVFVLVFTTILSLWYPQVLREELKGLVLMRKLGAILIIALGVVILAT